LDPSTIPELETFASRYIWWQTPAEALQFPARVIAQVMDIGDWEDVQRLAGLVGEDELRRVLTGAEAGQFRPRSWAYWCYRLGLASADQPPPAPPARRVA